MECEIIHLLFLKNMIKYKFTDKKISITRITNIENSFHGNIEVKKFLLTINGNYIFTLLYEFDVSFKLVHKTSKYI